MKILLTGAAGYLGSHLVCELANRSGYEVVAVDCQIDTIPQSNNVTRLTNEELFNLKSLAIDTIVNCAFARGNNASDLVSALFFNERLITKIKEFSWKGIINISSQGLYKAMSEGVFANEDSPIEPGEMYSLAKFSQERLFTSNFRDKVTSVRMASLAGNARFLVFFVEKMIEGNPITVTAPRQYVSIVDVRDAVSGILSVCDLKPEMRRAVYNLGNEKQYSIIDIARIVREEGLKNGYPEMEVLVEDRGNCSAVGMSCNRLKQDTGWKPRIGIETMIKEMILAKKGIIK